jgi:hypothetical protein
MKKTAALSIALALLIISPALARTHHHQHQKNSPGAYGHVDRGYAAPTYSNDVPFAPF